MQAFVGFVIPAAELLHGSTCKCMVDRRSLHTSIGSITWVSVDYIQKIVYTTEDIKSLVRFTQSGCIQLESAMHVSCCHFNTSYVMRSYAKHTSQKLNMNAHKRKTVPKTQHITLTDAKIRQTQNAFLARPCINNRSVHMLMQHNTNIYSFAFRLLVA